jgi:hypothetical protein
VRPPQCRAASCSCRTPAASGGSSGSPKWVRIFRIGPGGVPTLIAGDRGKLVQADEPSEANPTVALPDVELGCFQSPNRPGR